MARPLAYEQAMITGNAYREYGPEVSIATGGVMIFVLYGREEKRIVQWDGTSLKQQSLVSLHDECDISVSDLSRKHNYGCRSESGLFFF